MWAFACRLNILDLKVVKGTSLGPHVASAMDYALHVRPVPRLDQEGGFTTVLILTESNCWNKHLAANESTNRWRWLHSFVCGRNLLRPELNCRECQGLLIVVSCILLLRLHFNHLVNWKIGPIKHESTWCDLLTRLATWQRHANEPISSVSINYRRPQWPLVFFAWSAVHGPVAFISLASKSRDPPVDVQTLIIQTNLNRFLKFA